MRSNNAERIWAATVPALLLVVFLFSPTEASAHCDGMDGPMVKAARKALETGNANYALVWVQPAHEAEANTAFRKAASVRKLSREAGELADMYFFETLVRLHRAGEGETYTGLKPAGRDLGPVIPAADAAVESGAPEPLLKLFPENERSEILARFRAVLSRKNYNVDDIAVGREYVKAYVGFIHFVEGLHSGRSNHE